MNKLMFYDVETTGTNYLKHSILEIAAIIEIDGTEVCRFTHRVKPHPKAQIDSAALAKNGHRAEDFNSYQEMPQVLAAIKKELGKIVDQYDKSDKIHLIGYNNRGFDDNFFRMMFTLCGDNFFGSYFWPDSIDVLSLASHHLINERRHMPSFKLSRVAKTLGIPIREANLHEAMYDTELTREVYRAITGESLL